MAGFEHKLTTPQNRLDLFLLTGILGVVNASIRDRVPVLFGNDRDVGTVVSFILMTCLKPIELAPWKLPLHIMKMAAVRHNDSAGFWCALSSAAFAQPQGFNTFRIA